MTKAGIAVLGCEQSMAMYVPMFRYLNNGEFMAATDIVKEKLKKRAMCMARSASIPILTRCFLMRT